MPIGPRKEDLVDQEDLQQQPLPVQVGVKLLEIGYGVLSEQLGREPKAEEFAEMAGIMAKALLADGYLGTRGEKNAAEAEKWLRKTLSNVAAAVRATGSDALIKIDLTVKDIPNRLARHPQETPPKEPGPGPAPVPEPVCECKRVDGRCPECLERLSGEVGEIFDVLDRLNQIRPTVKVCEACSITEFDASLVQALPRFWTLGEKFEGEARTRFFFYIRNIICEIATIKRIPQIPLALQAWKERMESAGIKEGLDSPG